MGGQSKNNQNTGWSKYKKTGGKVQLN